MFMSNKLQPIKFQRVEREKSLVSDLQLPKQIVLAVCMMLSAVFIASAQTATPQATPPPVGQPTPQPQPRTETATPPTQTQQQLQTTQPNPPTVSNPAVTNPTIPGIVPQTPTQSVGNAGGIAPAKLPDEPPPIAPNFKAPMRPLPSADRVGVDNSKQLPLTLQDAIALALENNNDIDAAKNDVQIAEFNLRGARGVYDPVVTSENYYERRTTPTASTIGGASNGSVTQTSYVGGVGASGYSPYAGGFYNLDFSSSRLVTTNQNATLNPQFPSALTLSYTQPLWRGLRIDNNRRTIEIAKKNLSLTDAQFRQRAIETIAAVEQAYWDLVFALKELQVQIDAVKQARLQMESNQRLVEKGALAPIEITAANVQVTTFEQNVYVAQVAVARAENTLKTLMLAERTSEIWSRPLIPITAVELEIPKVQLDEAISSALTNRMELAQLKNTAEINAINERYYRDQTKPQIDLVGSYTGNGLAGTPTARTTGTSTTTTSALTTRVNELSALNGLQPLQATTTTASTLPPDLIGGYFKSLSNLATANYPTYRIGVSISLPIGNRTAKANLGRTLVESEKIKNQQAQTEQTIEADVRNSLQNMRSAEARLAAAAATRSSAEQLFESEQRQLRAGTSTVFLVFQRQNDLVSARGRELQAQTALNKAISELQRATGTTLTANSVEISKDVYVPNFVFRRQTELSFNLFEIRKGQENSGAKLDK
jgi:HAE1 family hydrophobic/amphiphilic exporter-1